MASARAIVREPIPSSVATAIQPLSPFDRFAPESHETSVSYCSFAMVMKLERDSISAADMNSLDRRIIRVKMPPTHAGIAAALRRAFEAAALEPSDHDFGELLRRLN
jgi:hypothetical protein